MHSHHSTTPAGCPFFALAPTLTPGQARLLAHLQSKCNASKPTQSYWQHHRPGRALSQQGSTCSLLLAGSMAACGLTHVQVAISLQHCKGKKPGRRLTRYVHAASFDEAWHTKPLSLLAPLGCPCIANKHMNCHTASTGATCAGVGISSAGQVPRQTLQPTASIPFPVCCCTHAGISVA